MRGQWGLSTARHRDRQGPLAASRGEWSMKSLLRVSAVAACLLLGGMNSFVAGQGLAESPDNHDKEFKADLGARSVLVQTKTGYLTTASPTYVLLTSGYITIPPGQTGYLLAT